MTAPLTNRQKIKTFINNWGNPGLFVLSLFVIVGLSALLFDHYENLYKEKKTKQVADIIAKNLEIEIQNRIAILGVIGKKPTLFNDRSFESLADSLIHEYPGFYAINFVNPSGVIQKIFPQQANKEALNKNLLNRIDVQNYLIEARASRTSKMSHKLMTFQGVPAFTLYTPLYDSQDQFLGWLNAVVDFDNWLIRFLQNEKLSHTRVLVSWNHPHSETIDQGPKDTSELYAYNYALLNQQIKIEIGFSPQDIDLAQSRHYRLMIAVCIAILLITLILAVSLNASRLRLLKLNSDLTLKNNLLSSLTHDISSPLCSLNLNLTNVLTHEKPLTLTHRERILRALNTIGEMLSSAKLLHAQTLGLSKLTLQPVDLNELIEKTLLKVADLAEGKNIRFDLQLPKLNSSVMAEPITLSNNVLLNILTNAIKFSPKSGIIHIQVAAQADSVSLSVIDQGEGFKTKQLEQFSKGLNLESSLGTDGEKGTGLGILQIQSFMEMYKGSLSLENAPAKGTALGACVRLKFQKSHSVA
jgi:signal transduction histidine kinase